MFTFESFRSVAIHGYDDLVDLLDRKKKMKIYYVRNVGKHSYMGCLLVNIESFRNIGEVHKQREMANTDSRFIMGEYSSDTSDTFNRVVDTNDMGISYKGSAYGSLAFTSEGDARKYLGYIRDNLKKKNILVAA